VKKNLVFAVSLVLIAIIVVGASTGWFGITGNVTSSSQKVMKEATTYRMTINSDKYEVLPEFITEDKRVHLEIENLQNGNKQKVIAVSGGDPVQLNPEIGPLTIEVGRISIKAGIKHALVKMKRV